MKIEYAKLEDLIIDGMLRHHEKEFTGMMLLRNSSVNFYNKEEWNESLRHSLKQMAYNIVLELKGELKDDLVIIEEGEEIMC